MKEGINVNRQLVFFVIVLFLFTSCTTPKENKFVLNEKEYYESQGFNVLVFTNWYNGLFGDEKMSGIELIHHEVRTATNGDVRINPTPEQWDAIPTFIERVVDKENQVIEARLKYPEYDFNYTVRSEIDGDVIVISVLIDQPLPEALVGKAGFNMEFLPATYFETSYLMDGKAGSFPLYPSGPMTINDAGETEPLSLAEGNTIVLAPEVPTKMVTIESSDGHIMLYDGRNKAQNGWYVLRTLIPANKTGKVVEWRLKANMVNNWMRDPMIAYSQVGYHPAQPKIAVIEFDRNDRVNQSMKLMKVEADGSMKTVKSAAIKPWGEYLRYNYGRFDFSEVTERGLYCFKLGNSTTTTFRIGNNIYETAWQPALDVYMPVQMDHMFVREAYRVWHGKSHMDDALQAPVNHEHFDLYAQGPTTDTPYKPGEHIPGLNVGGWYDAGDFDLRTQTHYHTITTMVDAWEAFGIDRDETLIDQKKGYVEIHNPDGKPDLLQQIEHGTLALIAQHRAVGHAIPGIIMGSLRQYTHLGDALTITDNKIYNPKMGELESDGYYSGVFDDRWAFTSRSTALNYGSAAGLASASRALKGFNDPLAKECLETAIKVWDEEQNKEPDLFRVGNTTGGELMHEELKAAVELLITTNDLRYTQRILEIFDAADKRFPNYATLFVKAMNFLDQEFENLLREKVKELVDSNKRFQTDNPFEVPITLGGWAGGGTVMGYAINNYKLHKAFPEIVSPEPTFNGLNFILGCHPASNLSLVSGIGTVSKKVGYGMNRADYSFIAGGVVPGVIVVPPDFPENKEDWPFLWGENEYVIPMSMNYMYLVHAVKDLLKDKEK